MKRGLRSSPSVTEEWGKEQADYPPFVPVYFHPSDQQLDSAHVFTNVPRSILLRNITYSLGMLTLRPHTLSTSTHSKYLFLFPDSCTCARHATVWDPLSPHEYEGLKKEHFNIPITMLLYFRSM
jgi:hypothetical protein